MGIDWIHGTVRKSAAFMDFEGLGFRVPGVIVDLDKTNFETGGFVFFNE